MNTNYMFYLFIYLFIFIQVHALVKNMANHRVGFLLHTSGTNDMDLPNLCEERKDSAFQHLVQQYADQYMCQHCCDHVRDSSMSLSTSLLTGSRTAGF